MRALVLLAAALLPGAAQAQHWAGAWGYATSPATKAVRATLPAGTYRYRLTVGRSGDAVRLSLTNPTGAVPLRIARLTVARAAGDGFALDDASERVVPLGTATIVGGERVETPAVDLAVKAGDDLIVTIVTDAPSTTVVGNAGFPVGFAEGAVDAAGATLSPQRLRPILTGVAVRGAAPPCTIATMGDSITEGARGTKGGWPAVLARRLVEAKRACAVVNAGVSGNRLLRDGRGTAAVERFERDIAAIPGVTHLILMEGINDIWRAATPGEPAVTADDLTAGYRRLIDAAHARGIRVIGGTMTPGWGSKYLSREMEQVRQDTNRWIRTRGAFDAVVDFEAALRDGSTPPSIRRPFDSGDRLHPGDNGYEAMGRAVPLALFGKEH